MIVCPLTKRVVFGGPPRARVWIPPWGLVTGHLAHGLSWIGLALLAAQHELRFSMPGLAWIHLVALGWLTLTSLTVLVHVIPGFLGTPWRGGHASRYLLVPIGLGMAGLITGFGWSNPRLLASSATLLVTALVPYVILAAMTVRQAIRNRTGPARVGNAFFTVFAFLLVTALLGFGMAWGLAGVSPAVALLSIGPAIHAHLGALGWLTLLVFGVFVRTVRPITGGPSPHPRLHVVASTLILTGVALLTAGFTWGLTPLVWAGGIGSALAFAVFTVDMMLTLRRATVAHRPPQAFLGAASGHALLAAVLGLGVLAGREDWQAAYAFAGLMGWLGQMVLGHLHHIGIRVLATVARGDEDDTRPSELLVLPLTWTTWAGFQVAVLTGTIGLALGHDGWVANAAGIGLASWAGMTLNVLSAWRRARQSIVPG